VVPVSIHDEGAPGPSPLGTGDGSHGVALANGNVLTTGGKSFTYDAENHLTALTHFNGGGYSVTDPNNTLRGGHPVGTVSDAGSITATITNNAATPAVSYTTLPVYWSSTVNNTAALLASSLATAINNAAGAEVNATVGDSPTVVKLQSLTGGTAADYSITTSVVDSMTPAYPTLFPSPSFAAVTTTMIGGTAPKSVYYYGVPSTGGYAPNGNILAASDSINGYWIYTYDTLNRLTSGAAMTGAYFGDIFCWAYDSFGNRTMQAMQTSSCSASATPTARYGANNQVNWVSQSAPSAVLAVGGFVYDAAGGVTADGNNQYAYDGEGRICAVYNGLTQSFTGYLYNADGVRVARGSITPQPPALPLTSSACNLATNGFTLVRQYLLDLSGNQVTEVDGTGLWQHSNLWAGAHLTATYDPKGLHFHLADPLGTRRVQTSATGGVEETCQSLPFGDAPIPCTVMALTTADDATEHHFTGKERDTESGNDYFGARYYASSMGRFMSPDWDSKPQAVPYASLADPQSLNLYSYVLNNPLSKTDPNGHDWFNVDDKWQWQKGHTYHDADGNATKAKGYAGLLVATATGTNKQGATTYSLTLYDQNKVAARGTGFSGNSNMPGMDAIKVGNYQILGRFDPPPTAPNPASGDNNPPPVYGYQKIDPSLNAYANAVYQAYGPMRARLNSLDGNTAGVYFHGQFGDAFHQEGYTHGCLSYGRDTTMINYMADHFGNSWTGVSVGTPVVKP